MIILVAMGCTTSAYDNPDITRRHANIQPIIKSSNGHTTNTRTNLTTASNKPSSSRLKRSKITPITNDITPSDDRTESDGRLSPALSDRTDTNKSIKRVAFTDDPELDTGSQATVTRINFNNGDKIAISGSPTELKRARRKRERNLRKRLLNKMGEAESLSERLLLESERLSLTSSMSRATSRTGSPHFYRSEFERAEDSITEVTAFDGNTPRPDGEIKTQA